MNSLFYRGKLWKGKKYVSTFILLTVLHIIIFYEFIQKEEKMLLENTYFLRNKYNFRTN